MTKPTKRQIEAAVKVLMQSEYVGNWVRSEAKFLGVDLDTPEGKNFFDRVAREMAERLVR